MNRIYQVIWNAIKGCYVAADEAAGTNQARGKIAVAVLATAMAVGVPASAATVENGVLIAEEGMTAVVLHDNAMAGGAYSGLGQTSVPPDQVSGMREEGRISDIADGIANTYVGQSRESTLVFSGTQDAESGVIDVENANKLNSNTVLSGTVLVGRKRERDLRRRCPNLS